jgi:hypothetical protein
VRRRAGARKTPPSPSLEDSILPSLDLFSVLLEPTHGRSSWTFFLFISILLPPCFYTTHSNPLFLLSFAISFIIFRRQAQITPTARASAQTHAVQVTRFQQCRPTSNF